MLTFKRPVLSKKNERIYFDRNIYAFFVDIKANKFQIKTSFEKSFKVKVESVNTSIQKRKKKYSGSLFRGSKLVFQRSYAAATQASMHFGSGVELRTNPKHSFSPHGPFHSTLTISPSLSSGINSNIRPINTDQIPGTLIVLNVVFSLLICLLSLF